MAWICPRCEQRIFVSRKSSIRFVLLWKYVKKSADLTVDVKNLKDIKYGATITHLHCHDKEKPGFKSRMKSALEIPETREHPLIF